MRIIGLLADKLLSGVVPKISAGACCTLAGKHFTESCGCLRNGVGLQKSCVVTCDCGSSCGACKAIPVASCR